MPDSKATVEVRKRPRTGFIIISAVFAVILIIVGIGYHQNYVAPFRRVIISVDDTPIRMGYFLKRVKLSGDDSMTTLFALTNEELIKRGATKYGIEVTPEDIEQELRNRASGDNTAISDAEFKEWYRQLLNKIELSDSEYREIVRASIIAARLRAYLETRLPTVAEQVHIHAIFVPQFDAIEEIKARLDAGENFADVATEVSMDPSGDQGGDLGWMPRGIMEPAFEEILFNLKPGEISKPAAAGEGFYLFMVSEIAVARELDENSQQELKMRVLESWLLEERPLHEIIYDFDSEIAAWISWQLSKG